MVPRLAAEGCFKQLEAPTEKQKPPLLVIRVNALSIRIKGSPNHAGEGVGGEELPLDDPFCESQRTLRQDRGFAVDAPHPQPFSLTNPGKAGNISDVDSSGFAGRRELV